MNRSSLIPLVVATVLALVGLHAFFGGKATAFDEAALDKNAKVVAVDRDGDKVFAYDFAGVDEVLADAASRDAPTQIVWLGNSQLHTVNQYKEGEYTAANVLSARLWPAKIDLLAFSLADANLQEHLVVFEYVRAHLDNVRLLILPVVFDDLRVTDIRDELKPALRDPRVVASLEKTEIGRDLLTQATETVDADLEGVADTVQERSERALNSWLEEHWTVWRARPEARGRLLLSLYQLRNTLLGINPQSKRPMIKGRRDKNMAARNALIDLANEAGIEVLLYVCPLRDDVEPPYVMAEYAAFKEAMPALAAEKGIAFADLSDSVPAEFWGTKASTQIGSEGEQELDFMHFRYGGHLKFADAVQAELERHFPELMK